MEIAVTQLPYANTVNHYYGANRAPFQSAHLLKLPLGSIQAQGWLRHPLEMMKEGMTGKIKLPVKKGCLLWPHVFIPRYCLRNPSFWMNTLSISRSGLPIPAFFTHNQGNNGILGEWDAAGEYVRWPEWEVFPATAWNYGLLRDHEVKLVEMNAIVDQPWTVENAPVHLSAIGKLIPQWSLERETVEELRTSPIHTDTAQMQWIDSHASRQITRMTCECADMNTIMYFIQLIFRIQSDNPSWRNVNVCDKTNPSEMEK